MLSLPSASSSYLLIQAETVDTGAWERTKPTRVCSSQNRERKGEEWIGRLTGPDSAEPSTLFRNINDDEERDWTESVFTQGYMLEAGFKIYIYY